MVKQQQQQNKTRKTWNFPLKIGINERMSKVLTPIQHYTEGPDHYYKAGKKNNRHKDYKYR